MAIGPLAIAMAGLKGLTAFQDSHRVNAQKKIEIATNNANAAAKQTGIMQNYTGVFQKMVSDIATQKNILATARIDKQSTFFNKALQEHEKSYLGNEYKMRKDMESLNDQRRFANMNAKIKAVHQQQRIAADAITGIAGSLMMDKQYQTGRNVKINGIR